MQSCQKRHFHGFFSFIDAFYSINLILPYWYKSLRAQIFANVYPQNVVILAIRKNKYPQKFCNKRRIFDDEFFSFFCFTIIITSDEVLTFPCSFSLILLYFIRQIKKLLLIIISEFAKINTHIFFGNIEFAKINTRIKQSKHHLQKLVPAKIYQKVRLMMENLRNLYFCKINFLV